jgi:hypothetical protein
MVARPVFFVGCGLTMLAAIPLMAFVTISEMQNRAIPLAKPYALIASIGAVGLALAFWDRRKIEEPKDRTEGQALQRG